MANVYLVITVPDEYEGGFTAVEAHLDESEAAARVEAANSCAESSPVFPPDDAPEADYHAFISQETAWREAHPFGPEVACGYLQQRYKVLPVRLGPRGVRVPDGGQTV